MAKLSILDGALVAVACGAVIYGMGFIVWRTLQMSNTVASLDRRLDSVAGSLLTLVQLRRDERQEAADLMAIQQSLSPMAMNIVFDGFEIFDAGSRAGEIGMGVFTVRNVGNEAVFLLGITATAAAAMPGGPARVLPAFGDRALNLRLDPGDPPLDPDKVTLWYRDLRGRYWVRSLCDTNAARVPDDHASLAARPAGEEHRAKELPAPEPDSALEPGGPGTDVQE
jgi:hypothetical protein